MPRLRIWLCGVVVLALTGCGGGGGGPVDFGAAVTLSGNWHQSCAIDEAGALWCWGTFGGPSGESRGGPSGRPVRVGSEAWREVAVGTSHACAIRADGALFCWGHNCAGQLGDGTRETRDEPVQVGESLLWRRVGVGGGHSCAIDEDGGMLCWGGADYGQIECESGAPPAPAPVPGRWTDVSSHYYSTHALAADGSLWRWKDVALGEPTPGFGELERLGSSRWRALATGVGGVCGVREDRRLACVADEQVSETVVGNDDDWGDVIASSYHTCALKLDGSLWCFGPNSYGELGIGVKSGGLLLPARVGGEGDDDWVTVAAGGQSTCARRRDGSVWCWGGNASGELGIGDFPYRDLPAQVGQEGGWSSPAVGYQFSCAVKSGGLSCWGVDSHGELGTESLKDELLPVSVPGAWTQVEAEAFSTCAIDDASALWCWGGTGVDGHRRRRIEASGGATGWASVGAGESKTCALDDTGVAWCWPSAYRADVAPLRLEGFVWQSVASSYQHSCGVLEDGTLRCWGENDHGQLGTGAGSGDADVPTQVAGGGTWLAVSVSEGGVPDASYSCGVRADGKLFCWGGGVWGHLGDGGEVDAAAPQQVGEESDWRVVAAGPARACAINLGGELWCWGRNDDGGLGIGSFDSDTHGPERVGAERAWAEVAVRGHTCATAVDGTLWCWGWGVDGQLGDGSAWRLQPTPVLF